MARTRVVEPEVVELETEVYDEISAEEERQAEAGTLFSIQGDRFANVQWSIHRYRTRREMMDDPSGEKTEWVADVSGELRGQDLVEQVGGGTFRFYGYVPRPDVPGRGGNGMKLAFNRLIRLAGPRRDFNVTVAVASSLGAERTQPASSDVDRRMDRLERMIETMAMRPQAPTTGITELAQAMKVVAELTPQPAASGPMADFEAMFGLVQKGIEIGQAREPVPANEVSQVGEVAKIVSDLAPLAMRFLDNAAQARRRPITPTSPGPPPGATPGHGGPAHTPTEPVGSHAEVVDDEQEAAKASAMLMVHRLSKAIQSNAPVDETADMVDDLVSDTDMQQIISSPAEVVIESIVQQASGRYPVLASPEGRAYMALVIAELKREGGEVDPVTG